MTARRAVAVAVASLAVCGSSVTASHAHVGLHEVLIRGSRFEPQRIVVDAGETVTWLNVDDVVHDLRSAGDDPEIDSPRMFRGDLFRHTFATVGAFAYECQIHAGMVGEVEVVDPALPLPPAPTRS